MNNALSDIETLEKPVLAKPSYARAVFAIVWKDIQADVRPFIEPGFDLSLLSLENLERVLGG